MSYIEERIRDHFIQSMQTVRESPTDYRINRDDFTAMVQRLGAKVERDRPLPDESVPVFVTLHIAGGTTRVYAAADDTPLGEFRESPRVIVGETRAGKLERLLDIARELDIDLSAVVSGAGCRVPLAVGDVVRLKTGGDWMTVESVGDSTARCVWFQKIAGTWSSTPSRDQFPIAGLEKRAL